MPRALIAALIIVIVFYVLVAVAALGTQPWTEFEGQQEAGLAKILEIVTGANVWGTILALGAGLRSSLAPCAVERDWALWWRDALWLTPYFTICVWLSLALAFVPPL